MKSPEKTLEVCYILSYSSPTYVRTEVLLGMLAKLPNIKIHEAINTSKGMLRYLQTILRLIIIRLRNNPDVYIIGFRGYEIYWLARIITLGKPLIFDEFINPYLWFIDEHKKFAPNSIWAKLLKAYARSMIISSQRVLTDTYLSAKYSSETMRVPISKFTPIYVGTNEVMFDAAKQQKATKDRATMNIFFYGNFLPLHGVDIIIEAAVRLKDKPVRFTIIGGAKRKKDMEAFTNAMEEKGLNNIVHKPWVPYEELPGYIADADLCLGGPFGDTPQSNLVITGKTYQFLAMGKCTVIGKIDEEVGFRDKKNCMLVEQGSSESLVDAIIWSLNHKDETDNIGGAGNRLYQASFSQEAQLHKIEKIISDAAS